MFKMRVVFLFKLLILMTVTGCSTIMDIEGESESESSKSLRTKAYEESQNGKYDLAIVLATQALRKARIKSHVSDELIEAYDDLGLYYFLKKDYQNSTYHQSIAVVLSHFHNPPNHINTVYIERLGWAYAKYNSGFNFNEVKQNPLLLICNDHLSINENTDLRAFLYERDKALSLRRKNKLGRTKLIEGVCNE